MLNIQAETNGNFFSQNLKNVRGESILFFQKIKKKNPKNKIKNFFCRFGLRTLQNIKLDPRVKNYFFRLPVVRDMSYSKNSKKDCTI